MESESSQAMASLPDEDENNQQPQEVVIKGNGSNEQVSEVAFQPSCVSQQAKQRRTRQIWWPSDIESHHLISDRDDTDGLWVLCKVCSESSGNYWTIHVPTGNKPKKNPACINLRHPYQMNLWERHLTENVTHIRKMKDLEDENNSTVWQPVIAAYFPPLARGVKPKHQSLQNQPGCLETSLALCRKYGIEEKPNDSCYGVLGVASGAFKTSLHNYVKYSSIVPLDGRKNDRDHHIGVITNDLIVVSDACNNKGLDRRQKGKMYSIPRSCKACYDYSQIPGCTSKLRQTISNWLKYTTLESCVACKGTLDDCEIEVCANFKNTPDGTLSLEGKRLKATVSQLLIYINMVKSMSKRDKNGKAVTFMDGDGGRVKTPSKFLINFNKHYMTNPMFKNELAIGLIECVVARFNGHPNAPLAPKVLNFFHLLESKSRGAFGVVSAQVYGPSLHHMVRVQSHNTAPPIIDFTPERILS